MSKNSIYPNKNRINTWYIAPIIGISLILILLGLLGKLLIYAQEVEIKFKESVEITVYVKEVYKAADLDSLKKQFSTEPQIKSITWLSKENAKEKFLKEFSTEDDPIAILGYNPLPASFNIKLRKEALNVNFIDTLKAKIEKNPAVSEVNYSKTLANQINTNLNKASLVLIGLAILISMITIVLIDNTTRITMYSNRFLIKTMQLVGAKFWFIARSFVFIAIRNGLICGFIAIGFLYALGFYLQTKAPEFESFNNPKYCFFLYLILLATGVIIMFISTLRSVRKYLKKSVSDLY